MAPLGYVKDMKNSCSCPFFIGPGFAFFQFSTRVHVKRERLEIAILGRKGERCEKNDTRQYPQSLIYRIIWHDEVSMLSISEQETSRMYLERDGGAAVPRGRRAK